MTSKEFIKNYWNYYLQLEQQVLKTQRFVDFNAQNNATYSIEYLQLYLAICSEIDVVAKIIAKEHNPLFSGDNIGSWGPELDQAITGLNTKSVVFNDDYSVIPWKNWSHVQSPNKKGVMTWKLAPKCKNPEWWTMYNKVKHQRTTECLPGRTYNTKANLKNVVLSLAALHVIEKSFLDAIISAETIPVEYDKGALYR